MGRPAVPRRPVSVSKTVPITGQSGILAQAAAVE
jgi:hypothetical protein